MKEKELRELSQQQYLEERYDITEGMRIIKTLESFLKRLSVIDKDACVIQTDWHDHEEWQYRCYRERVRKHEQEKSRKTSARSRS